MKKIIIKHTHLKRFKQQQPLIKPEDLVQGVADHVFEWVSFYTDKNTFVGYGYVGKQNKGAGWIVSFEENTPVNYNYLINLFKEAKNNRVNLFNSSETTAFRLFNGEGDGLGGLTIDWYEGYLVVSWYNETIYHLKQDILNALENSDIQIKGIYEKVRFKSTDLPESQFVSGEKAPEPLLVKENNVNYATYMDEGLMTGIFLDQREVRSALTDHYATNKTLLNMFSYTGAFSVAALVGGASKTTSVDLAKRSREKTQEQFEVNGLDSSSQSIIVMDVFDYFKYALRKGFVYDIVVLDPPSFSRNKKRTFSVAKDYDKLTLEAVQLIEENGLLIASTNAANVSFDKFKQLVETGIDQSDRSFELIQTYRLPSDFKVNSSFKEGNYLKVLFYRLDKKG